VHSLDARRARQNTLRRLREAGLIRRPVVRRLGLLRGPWALPRAVYYATPWAWVRLYARAGDWALFQLWNLTRPIMWALEDRAMALDREIEEAARRKVKRE
jgi:hypothetical protein